MTLNLSLFQAGSSKYISHYLPIGISQYSHLKTFLLTYFHGYTNSTENRALNSPHPQLRHSLY